MAGKRQDIQNKYPSRDGQVKNTPGRERWIFISSELKQNKITRFADHLDLLLKRNMKRDWTASYFRDTPVLYYCTQKDGFCFRMVST